MVRKRATTPPYVPRKGFRTVLDQIQSKAAGEVLTREELHKRGLSSHLTYPALAALRFIGLLDEEDRLTGQHAAFNREGPDLATQERLVREAYREFFDQVPLPGESLDALRGRFQEVFELSDRVINSAFPLFQFLAVQAGIELAAPNAGGAAEAAPQFPGEADAADAESTASLGRILKEESLRIRHMGYQIVINLQVTKHTSEKDIIKMVRTANRAVHLLKKAGDSF